MLLSENRLFRFDSPAQRYVQPPKRESCKPIITYKAPEVEFGGDSTYKTSFSADPQLVVNARPLPIKPQGHLVPHSGSLEKTTVTAVSVKH